MSLKKLVYTVYAFVITVVFIAWFQVRSWNLDGLRFYQVFSLLGLVAFVTMLTHYVAGFIYRLGKKEQAELVGFYKSTSIVVFACILFHPALIILNLKAMGFGLPPASYMAFYGQALVPYILLGIVAWLSFLAFEFKEKFSKKSWWKHVLLANDVAMLAIVVHGFRLGTVLRLEWFRVIWGAFFITLVVCMVHKYQYFRTQRISVD